jgi:hypothetical protein
MKMLENQNQVINIKPEDTEVVKCECGGEFFSEGFMMRRISAIMSPTGREEVFNIPIPLCIICGRPYLGEKSDEIGVQ